MVVFAVPGWRHGILKYPKDHRITVKWELPGNKQRCSIAPPSRGNEDDELQFLSCASTAHAWQIHLLQNNQPGSETVHADSARSESPAERTQLELWAEDNARQRKAGTEVDCGLCPLAMAYVLG